MVKIESKKEIILGLFFWFSPSEFKTNHDRIGTLRRIEKGIFIMINVRINDEPTQLTPRITVVGVGGAGGNAVNNMIRSGLEGCEFLVCNTDAQALQQSLADRKIQLGTNTTRGLGAGARPDVGRAAAEESIDEILSYLEGSNMVFITCGMGGGTGTGAAAVIARAARDQGILTVGVATKPFHFEGVNRMKLAEGGLQDLQQYVDTLIVIPNQNLFRIANEKTTFADAFKMADDVLQAGVRGVTDLMVMPGLINLDFADIKSVMAEMGKAMMGTGEATGERRAVEASESAISNPLLDDVSMKGAKGVLINITGGMDMTLFEVDEAANRIREEVDPDANIIFGSTFDESMEGTMRVSVVATGIDQAAGHGTTRTTTTGTGGYSPKTAETTHRTFPAAPAASTATATADQAFAKQTSVQTETAVKEPVATTAAPMVTTPIAETAQSITGQSTYKPFSTGSNIPAYKAPTPQYQQEQMKAQRIQGSFIPPQPMTAEVAEDGTQTVSAPAPQSAQVETAPQPQTKSPTLFERLTGSVTGRGEEQQTTETKTEPSVGGQKTLGIDKTSEESDLDIPAFLRRQAN